MNVRFLTLDRVRISAVLMVFLFHTARYFNTLPWHVKNPVTSAAADVLTSYGNLCLMPVLFGISGAAFRLAMEGKSPGILVMEKVRRLLIPFGVGISLLAIPQVYVEAVTQHHFRGSLIDFLPTAFNGLYGFGGYFPWMGLHLWYLGVLFIFSLVCLPVFRYFRKIGFCEDLQSLTDNSLLLFTPIIDIWIMDTILNPHGILGRRDFGGWNLFVYMVVFTYGFFYLGDREIVSKIRDYRFQSLFTGFTAGTAVLWILFQGEPAYGWNRQTLILNTLRATAAWCLTMAWIGWMHRPFPRLDSWVIKLTPWVLPVYMLHPTVIVFIGWLMVSWNLPVLVKGLILFILSAAVVGLLCIGLSLFFRKNQSSQETKKGNHSL